MATRYRLIRAGLSATFLATTFILAGCRVLEDEKQALLTRFRLAMLHSVQVAQQDPPSSTSVAATKSASAMPAKSPCPGDRHFSRVKIAARAPRERARSTRTFVACGRSRDERS